MLDMETNSLWCIVVYDRQTNMNSNAIVVSDFALALHNGNMDEAQVRITIKKMNKAKHFGVIIPKRFVRFIKVPHDIKPIEPPSNITDNNERIAYQIYADMDAIMCNKKH